MMEVLYIIAGCDAETAEGSCCTAGQVLFLIVALLDKVEGMKMLVLDYCSSGIRLLSQHNHCSSTLFSFSANENLSMFVCLCVLCVRVNIVSFHRLVQSQESELTYTSSQKALPIQVRGRKLEGREKERAI